MANIDLELVTPSALAETDVAIVRRGAGPYTAELVVLGSLLPRGGTVALDFGAAPGGSYIEETVTAASVTASSRVRAWVAGTTADHNAVEHALIAGRMGLSVVPGAGQFTIYAATDLRISGEVALTWEAV